MSRQREFAPSYLMVAVSPASSCIGVVQPAGTASRLATALFVSCPVSVIVLVPTLSRILRSPSVVASSPINITGFLATTDGDLKILDNVGTSTITLTGQDTNSAVANRLAVPAGWTTPMQLLAGETATIKYDGANSRWRLISATTPRGLTPTSPTVQRFLSGAANYTPPAGVVRIRLRMCGGGGGGGAEATNNGANGGDTSFGTWTAIHGNGGAASAGVPGTGGTGGVNGTGTLIVRLSGSDGSYGVFVG